MCVEMLRYAWALLRVFGYCANISCVLYTRAKSVKEHFNAFLGVVHSSAITLYHHKKKFLIVQIPMDDFFVPERKAALSQIIPIIRNTEFKYMHWIVIFLREMKRNVDNDKL